MRALLQQCALDAWVHDNGVHVRKRTKSSHQLLVACNLQVNVKPGQPRSIIHLTNGKMLNMHVARCPPDALAGVPMLGAQAPSSDNPQQVTVAFVISDAALNAFQGLGASLHCKPSVRRCDAYAGAQYYMPPSGTLNREELGKSLVHELASRDPQNTEGEAAAFGIDDFYSSIRPAGNEPAFEHGIPGLTAVLRPFQVRSANNECPEHCTHQLKVGEGLCALTAASAWQRVTRGLACNHVSAHVCAQYMQAIP